MSFTDIFGSNKPRCQHIREDGSRCKTDPQTGKKFCFMHDPEQKERQQEARRRGGETRNQLYPRKIPPTFRYQPPQNHAQVEALLDQIAIYYTEDEMDLRSARFYCYIILGRLGVWNSFARLQSKAARDAENQARIQRREKDPWSPQYGVLARAKAKEEAEKTKAGPKPATDEKQSENEDEKEDRNKYRNDGPGPLILGTTTMTFAEMQAISKRARSKDENRAKDEKHAEQAEAEDVEPTGSENTSEAPSRRAPQPVRNVEDEQRQQRIYQSDMNALTELKAEQVRAEAYKKGEWRRKRRR